MGCHGWRRRSGAGPARYAAAATAVSMTARDALAVVDADQCCTPTAAAANASCCGGGGAVGAAFGSSLYSADEHGELPAEAVAASLGCGNPMAVAELRAGERVLDLGSGGGIDVLLSARRVGDTGFAYGVDMTDEMLALARANATKAGATNVEFRKGTIENIPLPDAAVDVVISNLPRVALIERCAGLRPGTLTSVLAATKHTLRATARRWVLLNTEVLAHEKILTELTKQVVPDLVTAHGIGPDTASEMLIVAGDNAARVRSEPAWARLLGVAPVPASSGLTNRHRLNRGGHRQANAALYRAVIVRMQFHEPTKAYVARRTAEGKTKREIIRCLKRLLAREIWTLMKPFREASGTTAMAA